MTAQERYARAARIAGITAADLARCGERALAAWGAWEAADYALCSLSPVPAAAYHGREAIRWIAAPDADQARTAARQAAHVALEGGAA